ncbi:hypothetical protein [Virgibacillus pantothenticus]|uniref:hypothetical protein n=1 Tax=Virgibacillus pantothenticus TaxID=1473 RepID=UPI001BB00A52|nr:hypothetical protein [Virgibacillus pantothenticus]
MSSSYYGSIGLFLHHLRAINIGSLDHAFSFGKKRTLAVLTKKASIPLQLTKTTLLEDMFVINITSNASTKTEYSVNISPKILSQKVKT